MMSSNYEYFEKAYRSELAQAGTHFFCEACLIHKPKDDRSADSRYCQGCFDFLTEEAGILDGRGDNRRRSGWIPKDDANKRRAKTPKEVATFKTPHSEVFAHPDNENRKPGAMSGGRPALDLPIEEIKTMSDNGMKVKEIVRQLKADGIEVSRRTVYNVLAGQRVMV